MEHKTPKEPILELIIYDREHYERLDNVVPEEICNHKKDDRVNWINLDGLFNQDIIEKIQNQFDLHTLLIHDVVGDQRPKAEEFDDYFFFT